MPICLDPVQNQHSFGPDLRPNCFQRLSSETNIATNKESVKYHNILICFGLEIRKSTFNHALLFAFCLLS